MKRGRSQAFGVSYVCSEDTRGFSKDPQVLKNCMANWIPPSRKAVRCEALGSRCFLSVLFGSLSLSGSGEKSYCHISEGGYCGNLNSCFLGCAAGVVPYYEMIFEGCGAFANLSVLHGKGESSAGGSVGPGSSIEFGAPFLGEITALLHVLSDLSSGFPPLPNLPVTCSFREHLKVFIDHL